MSVFLCLMLRGKPPAFFDGPAMRDTRGLIGCLRPEVPAISIAQSMLLCVA